MNPLTSLSIVLLFACCTAQRPVLNSPNPAPAVSDIDSNDTFLWIGTDRGVIKRHRMRSTERHNSLSVTGYDINQVRDVLCMNDGVVWIATDHGLVKFDNYAFIAFTVDNTNLPQNDLLQVRPATGSGVLILTARFGWMRLHRAHFHKAANPEPGPGRSIPLSYRQK